MDNTKSGEIHQKASEATQPALCKANCGFFGAADKQGYCSVSLILAALIYHVCRQQKYMMSEICMIRDQHRFLSFSSHPRNVIIF